MATVFLARLAGMGGFQRTVALKRLHPHLNKNAEFVQMFLDEARVAALIHHPNVVPILELGHAESGYFLVMEYIEGDTLAALLSESAARGSRIPLPVSLRIVVDLLHGLHAAHELKSATGEPIGLVHRDVSPQNALVGTDGIARITDFGVARAASRLSATRAGTLKGKLAYMAPEQARGEEDVERTTDVFAAGVVLWEVLAFRRLFKADNHVATLNRVLSERIVSPRRVNPQVPEQIAAICLKALQRETHQRFQSCLEFADSLERAAMAAGLLATHRDVAQYVEEMAAAPIARHRQALRAWSQQLGTGAIPQAQVAPGQPVGEMSSVRPATSGPPPLLRASVEVVESPPDSSVQPAVPLRRARPAPPARTAPASAAPPAAAPLAAPPPAALLSGVASSGVASPVAVPPPLPAGAVARPLPWGPGSALPRSEAAPSAPSPLLEPVAPFASPSRSRRSLWMFAASGLALGVLVVGIVLGSSSQSEPSAQRGEGESAHALRAASASSSASVHSASSAEPADPPSSSASVVAATPREGNGSEVGSESSPVESGAAAQRAQTPSGAGAVPVSPRPRALPSPAPNVASPKKKPAKRLDVENPYL